MGRKLLIPNFIVMLLLLAGCDILGYHETCKIYHDCIYLINSDGNNLYRVVDLGHTDDSLMGGGGSCLPGADNIQFTSDDEKLVYGNDDKFYVINSDGSGNTLLTDDLRVWGNPSISTGNQEMIFSAYNNGSLDIFTVNINASGLNNLTNTPGIDEKYPYFSPRGDEIIYVVEGDSNSFISKLNINTGDFDTLHFSASNQIDYLYFSRDGERIFFMEEDKLFGIDPDGTDLSIVLDEISYSPSFSLDGSKITYNDYNNLYVMNSDGSGITVIESDTYPRKPQMSHDGTKVIYSVNSTIYIINSDGSNKREIYNGEKYVFSYDDCIVAFSHYFLYKVIHGN